LKEVINKSTGEKNPDIEDCTKYRITNQPKNIVVIPETNHIFEDFIFYQYTIYDTLKNNIKTDSPKYYIYYFD